jgi:hypothetical protein
MLLSREVCLHLRLSLIHDTILILGLTTYRHWKELRAAGNKARSTFKTSCHIHCCLHQTVWLATYAIWQTSRYVTASALQLDCIYKS